MLGKLNECRINDLMSGTFEINDIVDRNYVINFEYEYLLLTICMYKNEIINYNKYKSMLKRLYFGDTDCWYFGELKFKERDGNLYHCSITDNYYDKCETKYELLMDYVATLDYKSKEIGVKDLFNALKLITGKKDAAINHILVWVLYDMIKSVFHGSRRIDALREILHGLGVNEKLVYTKYGYDGYCDCEGCYCCNCSYFYTQENKRLLNLLENYFYGKES